MTNETLQQKIDAISLDHLKTNELYCRHFDDINKAIQEFREQFISEYHKHATPLIVQIDDEDVHCLPMPIFEQFVKDVLALIGEKK